MREGRKERKSNIANQLGVINSGLFYQIGDIFIYYSQGQSNKKKRWIHSVSFILLSCFFKVEKHS